MNSLAGEKKGEIRNTAHFDACGGYDVRMCRICISNAYSRRGNREAEKLDASVLDSIMMVYRLVCKPEPPRTHSIARLLDQTVDNSVYTNMSYRYAFISDSCGLQSLYVEIAAAFRDGVNVHIVYVRAQLCWTAANGLKLQGQREISQWSEEYQTCWLQQVSSVQRLDGLR